VLITGCTNVRMNLIAAKDVISPILWAQYPQAQGMNIDSVIITPTKIKIVKF